MKTLIYIGLALALISCNQQNPQGGDTEATAEMDVSIRKLRSEVQLHDSVVVGPLVHRTIPRIIESTGRIELPPNAIHTLHSTSGGYVSTFNLIPGDAIAKGTVLFTVTHPGIIEKQRLFLETAAERELAQKDFNRKKDLMASRATSAVMYEEAEAKVKILDARFHGLRKELELWGIDVEGLIHNGELQSEIEVIAPVRGIVDEVFVHPGQMISSEDPLVRIVNRRNLHLELQVLARHAPEIRKGQKVSFTLPGSRVQYAARIMQVNPQMNLGTETLNVHAHPEDAALAALIPGAYVQAKVELDSTRVVGLPHDAVVRQEGVHYAYAMNEAYIEKVPLTSVEKLGNMVVFDSLPFAEFVIKGAYYME